MTIRRRPVVRLDELRLLATPILAALVGLTTLAAVGRGEAAKPTLTDLRPVLVVGAVALAFVVASSLLGFRGDQTLLPLTLTLALLGVVTIERLGPDLDDAYAGLANRLLIYLLAGLTVLWVSAVPFGRIDLLQQYKYSALVASLALLAATFVFGTEVYGARLWIDLGPFQVQPSEIVKVTLVVYLAGYLSEKRDLLGSSWRFLGLRLPPVPYLAPMVAMWAASLAVLVVLNDLGSALLFYGIFLAMLYAASGRVLFVGVGLAAFATAAWLAHALFDRIDVRVQNWLDPWRDPFVGGYQQVQSDYALASGGLLGRGLGQGEPWRIPEVHTDFVFSAIGEELGLLGTFAVLLLYFALVSRGLIIAMRAPDGFGRLLATGLSATVGIQALIIIGGTIRLIPLTGITLPFVSYGGSSLLTNCLIVGLLLNLSDRQAPRSRA